MEGLFYKGAIIDDVECVRSYLLNDKDSRERKVCDLQTGGMLKSRA